MASACIKPINLNNNRSNHLQNNQNFVIISQSNLNEISHQHASSPFPAMPVNSITVHKLKNFTTIAPTPVSSSIPQTNSILGMNGSNIQSHQTSISNKQSKNCGVSSGNNGVIYKKKYTYANIPYGTELPPSVARRNARERNRVKQVNNGYANLRQHIPQTIIGSLTNGGRGASKKLSKVDTLRLAVEYIRRLQDVLIDDGASDSFSDGGSFYSRSGSSGAECEGSPQHPAFYHNNENSLKHVNQNQNNTGQNLSTDNESGYMMNQISYSDASVSPAPSYTSDVSIGSNHFHSHSPNIDHNQNLQNQFKYEPYDHGYNSITDTTPEDEDILDYISSWQEQ